MNLTAGVMGVTPPEQSELWISMTAKYAVILWPAGS